MAVEQPLKLGRRKDGTPHPAQPAVNFLLGALKTAGTSIEMIYIRDGDHSWEDELEDPAEEPDDTVEGLGGARVSVRDTEQNAFSARQTTFSPPRARRRQSTECPSPMPTSSQSPSKLDL